MAKTSFQNGNPALGVPGTIVTAEFLNATNNHRHTGLDEDGAGAIDYAVDTGAADSYAIALTPALSGHVTGMPIYFKAANTNTGASTLNVSGLGAVAIKGLNGEDLQPGDIKANRIVGIIYDGAVYQMTTSGNTLPRAYLAGLSTANNATTPATKLDIAAGCCRADDNSVDISLSAALTKRLNAAWAAGNDAGGLDSGAIAASTGYHVFLIHNTATGAVDVLFSTSATAPTMPSGYTKKRWIWFIRTDGSSQIRPYIQRGDLCLYKIPELDVNGANISASTGMLYTLPVPPGQCVEVIVNVESSGNDGGCYIHTPDVNALYPNLNNGSPIPPSIGLWDSIFPQAAAGRIVTMTNTSAQIRVDALANETQSIYIATLGWISGRGKND